MNERIVRRIHGEITHLHRLSDEELANHYHHASERMHAAHEDIDTIQGEMFRRAHTELPLDEEPELGQYAEIADIVLERTEIAQLGKTAWELFMHRMNPGDEMGAY